MTPYCERIDLNSELGKLVKDFIVEKKIEETGEKLSPRQQAIKNGDNKYICLKSCKVCGTNAQYVSGGCVKCCCNKPKPLRVLRPREIAINNGDKFYNGKACKKCETFKKYTKSYSCVYCSEYKNRNSDYFLKRKENDKKYCKERKKEIREYHMSRKYGITYDEYLNLLESQNNLCAICGVNNDIYYKQKNKILVIDHNHDNMKVRGIICHKCNSGLGVFKDNISLLKSAIEYLKENNE